MGVKKLLTFLNNYENLICEKKISDYRGTKIAIDISLLLYKLVIGVRNTGSDIINNQGDSVTHILGLFNKIILLLRHKIVPIFVFDGKASKLKDYVINERKKQKINSLNKLKDATGEQDKIKYFKKSFYITKKELDQCRELFDLMGIPYINAPEEADSQCAYLAREGLVDGVYTDDMDILTFGSPMIIKNLISMKNKPVEINLNKILETLMLSYDEFIDFCILLGCDYSNGISNINYNTIYNYYLKNKTIDKTLKDLKDNNFNVPLELLDFEKIKNYYKQAPYNIIDPNDLEIKNFNVTILIDLLVNKYGLMKFQICKKLNSINYGTKFTTA